MNKILHKLSLIFKLFIPSAIALFSFLVCGVVVFNAGLNQSEGLNVLVNDKFKTITQTQELIFSLENTNFQAHQLMVWGYSKYPADKIESKSKEVLQAVIESKKMFDSYAKLHDIKDKEVITDFDKYAKSVAEAVDITTDDPYLASMVLMKTERLIANLNKYLTNQQRLNVNYANSYYSEVSTGISKIGTLLLVLFVSSLLLVGGFTYVVIKYMKRTAKKMEAIAINLEQGNFVADERSTNTTCGEDEFGRAYAALLKTREVLNQTINEVKQRSDNVQFAASEISAGNSDVCARTEGHAAKIQEINASLAELTRSVQTIAIEAAQAGANTEDAVNALESGSQTFSAATKCMSSIEAQASKIQDITSMIDSISFQTNILALNAAIEAARAGEQGRGFSVVANEVRALAKQVEGHSREIKNLIEATVSTTKEGVVEMQKAHSSVKQIKDAISLTNFSITHIIDSTQQQHSDMSDVSNALNYLDDSTQATTSLVDQTAASASSLHELSVGLTQLTNQFSTQ